MGIFYVTYNDNRPPMTLSAKDTHIKSDGTLIFTSPAPGFINWYCDRKLLIAAFAPGHWAHVIRMDVY